MAGGKGLCCGRSSTRMHHIEKPGLSAGRSGWGVPLLEPVELVDGCGHENARGPRMGERLVEAEPTSDSEAASTGGKFARRGWDRLLPSRVRAVRRGSWESFVTDVFDRNAGLFMWLDLSPYLRRSETEDDGWAAERRLARQLVEGGVLMSTGERYQSERPGRFRMIFTYDEATLREGITR